MKAKILLAAIAISVLFSLENGISAQTRYIGDPVTMSNLTRVLKSKKYRAQDIVEVIRENGVDFKATSSTIEELFRAGARPDVIQAVKSNYRGSIKATAKSSSRDSGNTRYQQLLELAIEQFDEKNDAETSIKTLDSAVKINPAKPRAYQLLGFAHLYGKKRDFKKAEMYMRESLKRGGSAVFRIRHADDASFFTSCSGSLYINGGGLRYEDDKNDHTIDVQGRDLREVKTSGGWGKLIRFKSNVFEVLFLDRTNKKNKNDTDMYKFSPLSGKKQETKMIVELIGK